MAKRNLSQEQIDRKKHVGANLTRTTSAIGLGSLAALGATAGLPRAAKTATFARMFPKLTPAKALRIQQKTKSKLVSAGVVASGIGGYNGFNNASWQSAEARQRKKAVQKNWSPTATKFDAEAARQRRAERYETATSLAAPAAGAGAAVAGLAAVGAKGEQIRAQRKHKVAEAAYRQARGSRQPYAAKRDAAAKLASKTKALKGEVRSNKRVAGTLAAVAVGSEIAHQGIKRGRKNSWQTYAKRDNVSAFGVVHD